MGPNVNSRGRKFAFPANIYTSVLAIAFFTVLATMVFVAYQSYVHFGTFFKIPPN